MVFSNFFDTKKQYKELFLLIEIRNNAHISQAELARVLNVSPAMISKYITELEKRDLIRITRISQKEQQYELMELGIDYINTLMPSYLSDISNLKDIFQDHITRFQRDYELKIAITNSFGALIPYVANKLGFFKKNQMKIKLVEYPNGEKLMENFEKEKFDIALLGSVPAYLWKTYGAPIGIIASVDSGGHAIISINSIKGLSDLKGKKILIPENTTVTNNIFRIFIKEHPEYNINYDKDLRIKNVPIDSIENINNILTENSGDAIILWEPYLSVLLSKNKNLKILYDFSKHDNGYISNIIAVNEKFNLVYKETVKRFIKILSLTVDYYKDNTDEVDQIIAKKLKLPLDVVGQARKRTQVEIKKIT